jgi:hypothetical protein
LEILRHTTGFERSHRLAEAIAELCPVRPGGSVTAKSLGYRLRRFRGRVTAGGLALDTTDDSRDGAKRWVVRSVAGHAGHAGHPQLALNARTYARTRTRYEGHEGSPASPASPAVGIPPRAAHPSRPAAPAASEQRREAAE